ncbi:MAG: cupin domain-containing protein [Saprospiraceae bacterium]|jgi:quercetin dioxygenase-like cupin family protein|nr:cupin domain-containing protein [Saprospiraceae bacterium]
MHRRSFIKVSVLGFPLLVSQYKGLQIVQGNSGAIVVRAGSSRFGVPTPFKGINPNDLKLSSKDTNGQLSTFWYKGKEKTGPSFHSHPFQDEVFYVINGSYLFKLGNELTELNTGDLIFLPRNIPHTWTQISEEGQLFYFLQPAGKMEEFFLEMTRTGGKLSKDQANIVSEAHGIVNHGPGINWQDKHETISVLTNGFVVRSAIDRKNNPSLLSGNSPNFLKVAGSDTLDQLSIFEYHGKSKGGPPLHKHPFQDETFYVLSGTYLFVCGQDQFTLNPGDMIFLPKDVPHTWAQTSDEGKLLFYFQPAGKMEQFFNTVGKGNLPEGYDVFKDHDMEVTGPPIQY